MYLSMLSNEKKHLFLDLELHMSNVDEDFSDFEKAIIEAHCIEMRIDNYNYECEFSLEDIIQKIESEFTKKEKRIIFFELMATVLADGVYHDSEKRLIERLSSILEIGTIEVTRVFDLINDLKIAYEGCAKFVKGE